MRTAIELSDQLTTDTVLAMHEALMEGDTHREAGRFRTEPVWIGSSEDPGRRRPRRSIVGAGP